MGKSKTKTVGGKPVKETVANDFSNFLKGGLQQGQYGNPAAQTQGFAGAINKLLSGQVGDPTSLGGYFAGLNQVGGANISPINTQFNPRPFQNIDFSNPFNPQQVQQVNTQMPQWQNTQLQQMPTGGMNFGGANLQGINPNLPQFQGANLQNPGQIALNLPQFRDAQLARPDTGNPADRFGRIDQQLPTNLSLANTQVDLNNPVYANAQQLMNRELMKSVADMRARYGAGGAGQNSTSEQFGEATLRAEALPRMGLAMNDIANAQRGLNQGDNQQQLALQGLISQNMGQNQNAGIQQRGQDISAALQSMGLSNDAIAQLNNQFLQQAQMQNQFGMQGAELGMQAGNINAQNQLAQNAQQLQQAQMANQFGLQGAEMGMQAGQMNNQNALANAQLMQQGQLQGRELDQNAIAQMNQAQLQQALAQNQFGMQGAQLNQQGQAINAGNQLQQQGMNQDAINQLNQLMLQQGLAGNQYNQGNDQFAANFGQQQGQINNQQQMQNQELLNQGAFGMAGLGNQLQQMQLQSMMAGLNPLFQSYNVGNQLGTPQAQTVQQPGALQQGMNLFTGITGGLANLGMAGMGMPGLGAIPGLGGLFGNKQAPATPNYNPQIAVSPMVNNGGGLFGTPQLGTPRLPQGLGISPTSLLPYGSMPTLQYRP